MAVGDRFDGAKNGFAPFFGFYNTVAREIGTDRALALYAKAQEVQGTAVGKKAKEQAGIREFDAKTASSLLTTGIEEGIGLRSEVIEQTAKTVSYKLDRCPYYEAGRMAGLDGKSIESLCRAGSLRYMDAAVKQLNPKLCCQLRKMRSSADDSCEEAILLGD